MHVFHSQKQNHTEETSCECKRKRPTSVGPETKSSHTTYLQKGTQHNNCHYVQI